MCLTQWLMCACLLYMVLVCALVSVWCLVIFSCIFMLRVCNVCDGWLVCVCCLFVYLNTMIVVCVVVMCVTIVDCMW